MSERRNRVWFAAPGAGIAEIHEIDMQRLRDVLDRLLALVEEFDLQLVADMVAHRRRAGDAARCGKAFEPGGDIDAVAIDVIALDDHIPDMEADAEPDMAVFRDRLIAIRHAALHIHGAAGGVDDAAEFDK